MYFTAIPAAENSDARLASNVVGTSTTSGFICFKISICGCMGAPIVRTSA